MYEKMIFSNLACLTSNDQLKFVIQNREDYTYAKKTVKKYKPLGTIFFQPVWGASLKDLSSWVLNDGLDVRIGLQMHKIVWGDRKGV
jgi:7-carboxy-7-deazaguanine synthase